MGEKKKSALRVALVHGGMDEDEITIAFKDLPLDINLEFRTWEQSFVHSDFDMIVALVGEGELKSFHLFMEKVPENSRVITLTFPSITLLEAIHVLSYPQVDHLVRMEDDWIRLFRKVLYSLITGVIFGVERYIHEKKEFDHMRFRNFKGREQALAEVEETARRAGFRRVARHNATQVAEELIMNALYNAPRDKDGKQIFGDVELHDRVKLPSPKPISFRHVAAGDMVYMSVRDRFGTLDKATVLKFWTKCLIEDNQIDTKTIGAGLGLYFIVTKVDLYVVNIAPGVATEVIIGMKKNSHSGVPRLISFFLYEEDDD